MGFPCFCRDVPAQPTNLVPRIKGTDTQCTEYDQVIGMRKPSIGIPSKAHQRLYVYDEENLVLHNDQSYLIFSSSHLGDKIQF